MKKNKRLIMILLAPILIILSLYIYLNFLKNISVPCPIRLFTGIYCIGCGGTRCIKEFLHGHFLLAMRQNFIVFVGIVFLFLKWIQEIFSLCGKKIKLIPENRIFLTAVSGILIIYAVLRNLIPQLAPI